MGAQSLVGRTAGSLRQFSDWVQRSPNDEIEPGGIYEFQGTLSQYIVWALPDTWLDDWVSYAFSISHPKFRVLGAQVSSDGAFRIQVQAVSGSPILVIIIAITALLSIFAGMSIERVFQAVGVSQTPTSPIGAAKDLLFLGAIAAGGYALWRLS